MTRTVSPATAARKDYAFLVKELTELAREAERQRKTILAARLRLGAKLADRAAGAELLDPTPSGMGEFG